MSSPITTAIKQICEEKNISMESVIETIEAALAAAYRKDFGHKNQNIKVKFNHETGQTEVYDLKIVADKPVMEDQLEIEEESEDEKKGKVDKEDKKGDGKKNKKDEEDEKKKDEAKEEEFKFNAKLHITPEEAAEYKKGAIVGDEIRIDLDVPDAYGRMAAQTAKQVIIQKLREAERDTLFQEFKTHENEVITGSVQRREGRIVLIDLGRLTAILPAEEQIEHEKYLPGNRLKFYVLSVNKTAKGPEVIVSRAHKDIVEKLFSLEIPEIANESVEIKSIAREAGARSKIAVFSSQENIDPIGSCIGQRGTRVQTIINELGGEKVDIIEYNENPVKYITNALSPAKIETLEIDEEGKTAVAMVKEDQLSLAIGKAGQNVRLAAKLTGWKIDIQGADGAVVKSKPVSVESTGGDEDTKNKKTRKYKNTKDTGEEAKEKKEIDESQLKDDNEEGDERKKGEDKKEKKNKDTGEKTEEVVDDTKATKKKEDLEKKADDKEDKKKIPDNTKKDEEKKEEIKEEKIEETQENKSPDEKETDNKDKEVKENKKEDKNN